MFEISDENANRTSETVLPFSETLRKNGLELKRKKTDTLQINTGFLCNQFCKHCHLSCGPDRKENMDGNTAREVISYAKRCGFKTIDITGGAPELNPNLPFLIEEASELSDVMFRSNLTALYDLDPKNLIDLLVRKKVTVVCSMPSVNSSQTDSQRGKGIFVKSIEALKMLNDAGYGRMGSGLYLNLVSNPSGAFMPPPQEQAEKRFRKILNDKWGITFNNLFTFANMPLGRFRHWLIRTGNYEKYLRDLYKKFNACTIEDLMCRTQVSVSFDGYLYDCDFNLAEGVCKGNSRTHVSEQTKAPETDDSIAIRDHCYACTAGSGFT